MRTFLIIDSKIMRLDQTVADILDILVVSKYCFDIFHGFQVTDMVMYF